MILPPGFYTALGTPLDENANVVSASLRAQTLMQIDAGAAGLLVLGSMGIQAYVRQDQGSVAVAAVAEALDESERSSGKRPAFLAGVMDNSVARVLQRIDMLSGLSVDAVVATTPFYGLCGEDALFSFFTKIADRSPLPLCLYDLPGVTKMKITFPLARKLAEHPNIVGIKTGDIVLARQLWQDESAREKLMPVFSGLDVFDVASSYGIDRFLDGMFACCPRTTSRAFEHFKAGRVDEGGRELNRILDLRDTMIRYGIFPAFSLAMNMLDLPGNHSPDYESPAAPEAENVLRRKLLDMREIEA